MQGVEGGGGGGGGVFTIEYSILKNLFFTHALG